MKGDFSRRGFDPSQHFSRVLMQQGRVLLDSDWNEQTSMLLYYLRTAVRDFSGPVASINGAFKIKPLVEDGEISDDDFLIARGHLYVDGLLCENDESEPPTTYRNQPYLSLEDDVAPLGEGHLVYIDVWEQHITHIQHDRLREVALGGPDTTTRARIVWQLKLWDLSELKVNTCDGVASNWEQLVDQWQPRFRGALRAETIAPSGFAADDPCITAPDARYRGPANRLYRIEVHRGGPAETATFKWSRDNGSVVFSVISLTGNRAVVESLGSSDLHTVAPGTWLELVDDRNELLGEPGQLAIVEAVDPIDGSVELTPAAGSLTQYDEDAETHPILRRWDYEHHEDADAAEGPDGALRIKEDVWITVEDGINVWFGAAPTSPNNLVADPYRTGDYWLIPARTATGDIEWPVDQNDEPKLMGPHGVEHHYAALAVLQADGPMDCLGS
jgi:hypothetical protein